MSSKTRHAPLLVSACLAVGLIGCTAVPPTPPIIGGDAGTGTNPYQPGQTGQADMAGYDAGPLAPPVLAPVAQTSPYNSVPVHGTAVGASALLITTIDNTISANVDATGAFCIDLPLQANTANHFSLVARDGIGNESTAVTLDVTQSGTPPTQAPTMDTSTDASIGGVAKSYHIGITSPGPDSNIIDDDTNTYIEGHFVHSPSLSPPNPTVVVQLVVASHINQIDVRVPGDCVFYMTPTILYATTDAPATPDVSTAGWTAVPATVSSDYLTATASFADVAATNVALVWDLNASGASGCGVDGLSFGVAEIAAWTVPNVAPPAPSAPSCAGGASQ